ncbi:hypothetical protein G6F62_014162 [Rhizopus arrhizus]|nr:hypothetical protein G6F62_014162 [Rhizopus arrhizus]
MAQTDYWLEMQGRLTEAMRYAEATDHYVPCSWDDAFALIGRHLQALDSPHQAEFYTSGRTPNEAAFLYSIFPRPAAGHRRGQGHHRAAGLRARRGDLRDRPEHRHQFAADDEQPGRGAQTWHPDRGGQSDARARADPLRRAAGRGADGHAGFDRDQQRVRAHPHRRRPGADQGHDEGDG